jgi:hypothetical protein
VKTRFARARESSSSERCGQQQCSEANRKDTDVRAVVAVCFAQSSNDAEQARATHRMLCRALVHLCAEHSASGAWRVRCSGCVGEPRANLQR